MIVNAFIGSTHKPTEAELHTALGDSVTLWERLVSELVNEFQLTEDWNSYSPKAGWALRLQAKKRNIVYLSPGKGSFMASFALGDRAMAEAKRSKLPKAIMKILADARRYAEGSAVRIDVASASDVKVVEQLTKIKMEN